MCPSHEDTPALVSLTLNPVEIKIKESTSWDGKKAALQAAKFQSCGSNIPLEDDGFAITSCFVAVMKTMKLPARGGFMPSVIHAGSFFGCHEVWRWGMKGAVTCCSCLPSKSSSIFLSLQLSLPLRIFSAGTWKRKPCNQSGPYGVLCLLFC